ncbi:peptidase [Erwinia sp. S43]|uniref:peptidase n=1 Tax=Erwinia sp. S43 TaxID=2769339 RepID=UPI00190D6EED|nr:peptidase [Erwinia sp. S43]MBK0033035.1 peptidase [Erwinia sp. S43]
MLLKKLMAILMGLGGLLGISGGAQAARPPQPAMDAPGECRDSAFLQQHPLTETLRAEPFVIFYTRSGDNAPPLEDTTGSGTPDYVKNVAIQLQAANQYYQKMLRLTPPLEQPRYRLAKAIHVYLFDLPRGNGMAFDEVTRVKGEDGNWLPCALTIRISSKLNQPLNPTPAHELFHLYQYGYTQFKVGWLLEGMTRWIESAYNGEIVMSKKLQARPPLKGAELYALRYSAWPFWQRLAREKYGTVTLSPELEAVRYLDGNPVFRTTTLPGGEALEPLLTRLQELSKEQSRQANLPYYQWPEKLQQSHQFDDVICQAMEGIECSQP